MSGPRRPWWEPPADGASAPSKPGPVPSAPSSAPSSPSAPPSPERARGFKRPSPKKRPPEPVATLEDVPVDIVPAAANARVPGIPSGTKSTRLPILYAEGSVVVIAKPAGLSSVPSEGDRGKTCLSELRVSHPTALAVHRLDRDVSGALCFALDEPTRAALEEQFRARTVRKIYLAAVNGTPRPAQGTIQRPIVDLGKKAEVRVRGAPSITHYKVVRPLDSGGRASLIEIELETGRHNQIRLHFVAIGHSLIGERKYARGRDSRLKFGRPALHAWKLSFAHPQTRARVELEAPLPDDFAELIGGAL